MFANLIISLYVKCLFRIIPEFKMEITWYITTYLISRGIYSNIKSRHVSLCAIVMVSLLLCSANAITCPATVTDSSAIQSRRDIIVLHFEVFMGYITNF